MDADLSTVAARKLLARERSLLRERSLEQERHPELTIGMLRRSLEEVESALGRLWLGTWGTCTSCGEEIEAERLAARPETALCSRCR